MKNKTIVFLCFFLTGLYSFAQENTIPLIEETIKIDGQLDEKAWSELPTYSDFNNFYPDDIGKAKNQTEVKLFHNGSYLYISAIYTDTTSTSMISSLKRDDFVGIILNSDNFQVVIDTYNKKSNGYFFSVNTSNAQLDGLVSFNESRYDMNESWSTIWQSKTKTEGNKKIFEIAIPLKALNFDAENSKWALNFIMRDNKANNWMTWTDMPRNYIQHDLRTTKTFTIDDLPKTRASKFIVIPSISYNYSSDVKNETSQSNFKPSLDGQFSLTSSLKLDATINPDFSQIDVDQQVTNLTRFAINFPERRNFFIENSDLFSSLGTDEVNPFYSRRIGSNSDIQFGLKVSGNITAKSRIGILDVQTQESDESKSQNYGAFVFQQQLSKRFTTTAFLINRQETDDLNFKEDFNRVTGLNLNYKSVDNKWTGIANFGKSFSENINDKNSFYNLSADYSTKKVQGSLGFLRVDRNYITDVGFTPRLYNFDARNNIEIREGYSRTKADLLLFSYPQESKTIQTIRYFGSNTIYFDEIGKVSQSLSFYNHAIWFKNASAVYINVNHKYDNLKYAFDPLGNGNVITPGTYNYGTVRIGYNSVTNKKVSFNVDATYGKYYGGNISSFSADATYRLLPIAKFGVAYEFNYLNLKELGSTPFHLAQFTGEIFFNNRLNWTTYLQYNTQRNNFNINSRLQWEYKPLSYLYLVVSDNYNQDLFRTNWGVAFKMNYRFDF